MEKLPSISKNVRCVRSPTLSMSVVRKHFWTEQRRGDGGSARPSMNGIICCMPAVLRGNGGALSRPRLGLGSCRGPRARKKSMKGSATRSLVHSVRGGGLLMRAGRRRHGRLGHVPQGLEAVELLRRDGHLDAVAPLAVHVRDVAADTLHLETALAVGGDGAGVEVVHAE